jgi:tellurite resistance protein TerB
VKENTMPQRNFKRAKLPRNAAQLRGELAEADASVMEAIVAGCAIVAYSDGWASEDERRRMRGLIGRFEPIVAFGIGETMQAFDDLSAQFAHDHDAGEAFALAQVARLAGRRRDAELLIETCCAIAEADGGFDREEREAILSMCALLEIDPGDHGL